MLPLHSVREDVVERSDLRFGEQDIEARSSCIFQVLSRDTGSVKF